MVFVILEEHEELSMIAPDSYKDPRLKELIQVLIDWINDELASQRIIVKDLEADLYDGQILQKLLGKFQFFSSSKASTSNSLFLSQTVFWFVYLMVWGTLKGF